MISKSRFGLKTAAVLMVFALSAIWTASVLADDETPPPPVDSTTIEVPPPVDAPVVADSPTVSEMLEQVPEGTDVVVVNTSGDPIPLASQEAADAILTHDPVWCPTGVAPKDGTNGCSPAALNLSDLVASGNPLTNGTIWIEAGTDSGTEVVIDGAGNWMDAVNFSLTLQGGWNGTFGSTGIIGTSIFDTAISIVNWNGAVTVKDITMQGASNTSYSSSGALYVDTKKNIVLSNVTAINTASGATDGAYLDNTDSTTQATVTVKNSSFNNNTSYGGLTIYSKGVVTLTNVSANNNKNYGVYVDNDGDLVASAITINNSSFTGSTSGRGLEIYSNGSVKLNMVTAIGNSGTGVYVDNSSAPSAQAVTGTGFLTSLQNGASGLEIYSKGVVSLTSLTTNRNSNYGTYINNTYGSGTTAIQAVNITGTNAFNDNYGYNGLYIGSRGAITVTNVTAVYNGINNDYEGVYLYNAYDSAKPQNVTLNGYNFFRHNGYDGFAVTSYGAITVNNITAIDNGNSVNDNSGSGVHLDNSGALLTKPANITINGNNSFTNNDYAGLAAYSKGMITTSNLTASNNGSGGGVYLDNSYSGSFKAVLLKGTNAFSQNAGVGLTVYSKGAITVGNVTAATNGDDGAYLDNSGGTSGAIALTGYNTFSFNVGDGIQAMSRGIITVTNITAYQNGDDGAFLYNQYGVERAVFVNGYGLFEYNANDGLQVFSNGAITTINLNANQNDGHGATLNTIGIVKPQAVTLNGNNNFNYNGNSGDESGLYINSDGTIRVNKVTASYNYSNGAYLNNYANWDAPAVNFATFGSVIITGFGNFTGNGDASFSGINEGLYIYTHGAATLNYVTANFNTFNDGIGIDADGAVTLVCSSANNNAFGLYIYGSPTILTLKGFYAAGNTSVDESLGLAPLVRTRCP